MQVRICRTGNLRDLPAEIACQLEVRFLIGTGDLNVDGSRQSDARIVSYLSRQLGMSDRSLRRRCHEAFGYGPKTLHRILRFQRYLQMAESRTDAAAADLAMDAGYADQPHLIRETRELAGLTPRELVAQLAHRP